MFWLFKDKSHLNDKYFLISPVNIYAACKQLVKPIVVSKPIIKDEANIKTKTNTTRTSYIDHYSYISTIIERNHYYNPSYVVDYIEELDFGVSIAIEF